MSLEWTAGSPEVRIHLLWREKPVCRKGGIKAGGCVSVAYYYPVAFHAVSSVRGDICRSKQCHVYVHRRERSAGVSAFCGRGRYNRPHSAFSRSFLKFSCHFRADLCSPEAFHFSRWVHFLITPLDKQKNWSKHRQVNCNLNMENLEKYF
ncbi:hypothetical protein SDC9_160153 [bioreactor metagenome]|uniref:Uncharacterized protein n=1 Tax=bioreactor metagenome TaxID=1076179 RepID=A0A645FKV7_9ZZZZ